MTWQERHKLVAAVYVVLQRDDKILMLRRAGTGYCDGQYSVPAGHLEGDEAPTAAVVREAYEEVGVTIDPKDLECVHSMVYKAIEGDHERLSLFFRAANFMGEPHNAEPNKCDDVRWFSVDALPSEMVWEVRHALDQIKTGPTYSEANY